MSDTLPLPDYPPIRRPYEAPRLILPSHERAHPEGKANFDSFETTSLGGSTYALS